MRGSNVNINIIAMVFYGTLIFNDNDKIIIAVTERIIIH